MVSNCFIKVRFLITHSELRRRNSTTLFNHRTPSRPLDSGRSGVHAFVDPHGIADHRASHGCCLWILRCCGQCDRWGECWVDLCIMMMPVARTRNKERQRTNSRNTKIIQKNHKNTKTKTQKWQLNTEKVLFCRTNHDFTKKKKYIPWIPRKASPKKMSWILDVIRGDSWGFPFPSSKKSHEIPIPWRGINFIDLDLDEDELGGRFSWTPPPVPDRVEVAVPGMFSLRQGGKDRKKTMEKPIGSEKNFKQQVDLCDLCGDSYIFACWNKRGASVSRVARGIFSFRNITAITWQKAGGREGCCGTLDIPGATCWGLVWLEAQDMSKTPNLRRLHSGNLT